MEKQDYKFYIQVRTYLGETPSVIHKDLVTFARGKAVTYPTVLKWHQRFSEKKWTSKIYLDQVVQITAVTTENIEMIWPLIEEDPNSTYDDLEADSLLLRGTIETIIQDRLQKVKVASRWAPHKLTDAQKERRLQVCKENLERISDGQLRLGNIIAGDETWLYLRQIGRRQFHYTWIDKGQPPDTLVRRGKFEEKRLYYFFLRAIGWVAVRQLAKGEPLDHEYDIVNCLSLVVKAVSKDRPKSGMRGLRLLHDNAKPHVNSKV